MTQRWKTKRWHERALVRWDSTCTDQSTNWTGKSKHQSVHCKYIDCRSSCWSSFFFVGEPHEKEWSSWKKTLVLTNWMILTWTSFWPWLASSWWILEFLKGWCWSYMAKANVSPCNAALWDCCLPCWLCGWLRFVSLVHQISGVHHWEFNGRRSRFGQNPAYRMTDRNMILWPTFSRTYSTAELREVSKNWVSFSAVRYCMEELLSFHRINLISLLDKQSHAGLNLWRLEWKGSEIEHSSIHSIGLNWNGLAPPSTIGITSYHIQKDSNFD